MTYEQFTEIAKKLKTAYRTQDKFLPTIADVKFWYEHFKTDNPTDVDAAVEDYIIKNRFAPTIADIKAGAERSRQERETLRREINNYYDHIMSGYPGEKNGKEIFERLVFDTDDTDKQIQMAAWITAECLRQVDRYESGEAEFVVLEEYLKSLEMEICRRRKQ